MNRRTRMLGVPYALVRVPVTIVDRAIIQRLRAHSRTRTVFDHGLGVADHWAGLILDDAGIVHSGRLRIEHAGRFTGSYADMSPGHHIATTKSYASTRAIGQSV